MVKMGQKRKMGEKEVDVARLARDVAQGQSRIIAFCEEYLRKNHTVSPLDYVKGFIAGWKASEKDKLD